MAINTEPYAEKIIKPWGYEIIFTKPRAEATGKILHLIAGERLSLQYHDQKTETLCLINGEAKIVLGQNIDQLTEIPMELNKGYYINKQQLHRIVAVTDCDVMEASTPEKGNTVRVEDDANRGNETEAVRQSQNRGWAKNG